MKFLHLMFLTTLFCATAVANQTEIDAIGKVIDNFHDAAKHGDNARYLGSMSEDAVFMGTDEWERWPKQPVFVDYVASRFKDGSGWDYHSVERVIHVSDSADFAWFDEVIESATNGRFRGTGVLTRQDGEWKIAHYAMSFLIFNENWEDVVELTKKTRAQQESDLPHQ